MKTDKDCRSKSDGKILIDKILDRMLSDHHVYTINNMVRFFNKIEKDKCNENRQR